MFVYTFLSVTLLLAAIACYSVYSSLSRQHWLGLAAALFFSAFVYLYGAWIFLSAYAKYGFLVLIVLMLCLAAWNAGGRKSGRRYRKGTSVTLILLFLLLDILYYTGTTGTSNSVDLSFPLKGERYFVFQGGKGLPANMFHYNTRQAAYAIDIVKLDKWGRRCSSIFSKQLSDYYIFGDTVYSPCDGLVLRAVSDNPDNVPPHRGRGPHNLNGVLVEGSNCFVYLGHFQRDAVFVQPGQKVKLGQPLGLAGNSGKSIEPHLHIQVHEKGIRSKAWYQQPQLFIRFNGKEYLLFHIIER